jgi:glycerol uptake facilitator-like aquaporin
MGFWRGNGAETSIGMTVQRIQLPRASSRAYLVSTLLGLAVVGVGAWLMATWIRYGLIERDDLGPICEAVSPPWWCDARMLVIQAFLHDVFGLASVASAILALWRRSRALAYLAVASGVVGMVLYNFTWAGAGVIGGAMILARHARPRQQHGEADQHAR